MNLPSLSVLSFDNLNPLQIYLTILLISSISPKKINKGRVCKSLNTLNVQNTSIVIEGIVYMFTFKKFK